MFKMLITSSGDMYLREIITDSLLLALSICPWQTSVYADVKGKNSTVSSCGYLYLTVTHAYAMTV